MGKTPCAITSCVNPAQARVNYLHPDEKQRWQGNLCMNCVKAAQARHAGTGEWSFGPVGEWKDE